MKTLFVVADKRVNAHVGESYDALVEVEWQPTTETIQVGADRIKDQIRALWHEQLKAGEKEPKVSVNLDAASPYNAMLLNLRIIMKAEEGIVIELPYLPKEILDRVEGDKIEDAEAKELLRKLNVGNATR